MPVPMNVLKLPHPLHDRWPSIKIILVSGQVARDKEDRPANSRFFKKPVEVREMIAELQGMIGKGALKIIPTAPLERALAVESNPSQQTLTAENSTLRLL